MNLLDVFRIAGAGVVTSLWAGAALAAWVALTLRLTERAGAAWRYRVAIGALAMLPVTPAIAWFVELPALPWLAGVGAAWTLGATVALIRLVNSARSVGRLRRGATPAPAWAGDRLDACAHALGIADHVRLVESDDVDVPCSVGRRHPMVVLPRGAAGRLTDRQVTAVLAHELAHVARRDYAWHLVEVGVCTVLFYHPAAWWLSRVVEKEREASCDVLASRVVSPIDLAEALVALERARQGPVGESAARQGLVGRITALAGGADAGAAGHAHIGPLRLALGLLVPAAACIAVGAFGFPLAMTAAQWSMAPWSMAVGIGLLVGVRHAFEPDHLMALATLVTRERRPLDAVRLVVSWGLGHTVSLLLLGLTLSIVEQSMPERMTMSLELGVALMLLVMGLWSLREAWRVGGSGRIQPHRHGFGAHAHPTSGDHVHIGGLAVARRPLAVGMVHGLAGSAGLTALMTSALPTLGERLGFVLLFGCGSTAAMALAAGLAGWPMARIARSPSAMRALSATAGAAAVVFAFAWGIPLAQAFLAG